MDFSRRDFMGLATATVAAGAVRTARVQAADGDSPLGVRRDFPVLDKWTYLNSPYIAPSPQSVVDATVDFHQAKASDPISLGSMLDETRTLRGRFAELVNAEVGEVGILSTTSEGENIVTKSLDLRRGDNVVIDDLHYDTTVFLYNHLAEVNGIELRVVSNAGGAAPAEAFARHVDERTRIISVAWVSHQNGYRHDLGCAGRPGACERRLSICRCDSGRRRGAARRQADGRRFLHHRRLQVAAGRVWHCAVFRPQGTPRSRSTWTGSAGASLKANLRLASIASTGMRESTVMQRRLLARSTRCARRSTMCSVSVSTGSLGAHRAAGRRVERGIAQPGIRRPDAGRESIAHRGVPARRGTARRPRMRLRGLV